MAPGGVAGTASDPRARMGRRTFAEARRARPTRGEDRRADP